MKKSRYKQFSKDNLDKILKIAEEYGLAPETLGRKLGLQESTFRKRIQGESPFRLRELLEIYDFTFGDERLFFIKERINQEGYAVPSQREITRELFWQIYDEMNSTRSLERKYGLYFTCIYTLRHLQTSTWTIERKLEKTFEELHEQLLDILSQPHVFKKDFDASRISNESYKHLIKTLRQNIYRYKPYELTGRPRFENIEKHPTGEY